MKRAVAMRSENVPLQNIRQMNLGTRKLSQEGAQNMSDKIYIAVNFTPLLFVMLIVSMK